jgi:hypothetical protein
MVSGKYVRTAETRLKISRANKGRKRSAKILAFLSASRMGEKNPRFGKHCTEETKKKIGDANRGRKWTEHQRKKFKEKNSGKKHHNWKGGASTVAVRLRATQRMKAWRMAIFERDGFRCVWCGDDRGGNLEADHIREISEILETLRKEEGQEEDFLYRKAIDYPPLWDLSNGRTLCEDCHIKRHKNIIK